MDRRRLELIERRVLGFFETQKRTRVLAKELFANMGDIANADIVRALEALEKKTRMLVRHTSEGDDYVSLTPEGATAIGLSRLEIDRGSTAIPHPPKSATKRS